MDGNRKQSAIAMAQYPQSPRCYLLLWRLSILLLYVPTVASLSLSHYGNVNMRCYEPLMNSSLSFQLVIISDDLKVYYRSSYNVQRHERLCFSWPTHQDLLLI